MRQPMIVLQRRSLTLTTVAVAACRVPAGRFVADAVTGPSTDTAARTAANATANPNFRLAKRRGHADDGTPRRRL